MAKAAITKDESSSGSRSSSSEVAEVRSTSTSDDESSLVSSSEDEDEYGDGHIRHSWKQMLESSSEDHGSHSSRGSAFLGGVGESLHSASSSSASGTARQVHMPPWLAQQKPSSFGRLSPNKTTRLTNKTLGDTTPSSSDSMDISNHAELSDNVTKPATAPAVHAERIFNNTTTANTASTTTNRNGPAFHPIRHGVPNGFYQQWQYPCTALFGVL